MIRFLILDVVLPLFLLFLLRSVIKNIFTGGAAATNVPQQARREPPVPAGGELKKDPVCGTYVSAAGSITRTIDKQVFYFCSTECRDKFRAS